MALAIKRRPSLQMKLPLDFHAHSSTKISLLISKEPLRKIIKNKNPPENSHSKRTIISSTRFDCEQPSFPEKRKTSWLTVSRWKNHTSSTFSHSFRVASEMCVRAPKIMASYANIWRKRPKALYVNMAKFATAFHAFYFGTTTTAAMMLYVITEQIGRRARANILRRSNSVTVQCRLCMFPLWKA